MRFGKILSIILVLTLVFTMAACGSEESGSSSSSNSNSGSNDSASNEQKQEGKKEEKKLDFPKKPINLIVPWSAGGSTDTAARAMAEVAESHLGQPLVVVNKDGAGGTVGTTAGAQAKADGYTVTLTSAATFTTQPLMRELQYSLEDFKAIVGITYEPLVLTVNGDSPYNTVQELVDGFKESGEKPKFGHPGVGSFGDLSQRAFFAGTGIEADSVPFKGNNPAIAAVLGNHIDVGAFHPSEVIQHQKDGKLKILGIFAPERFDQIPDVPTMVESGYDMGVPEHDFAVWKFLLVPKDTPDEIVAYLTENFTSLLNDPKFEEFAKNADLTIRPLEGETVLSKLASEAKVYKAILEGK